MHTRVDRPEAFLEITTFTTNEPVEGWVDSVLLDMKPRCGQRRRAPFFLSDAHQPTDR